MCWALIFVVPGRGGSHYSSEVAFFIVDSDLSTRFVENLGFYRAFAKKPKRYPRTVYWRDLQANSLKLKLTKRRAHAFWLSKDRNLGRRMELLR